ncbi:hypothetical protein B0H16DRAFT_1477652 [Mycena metata]|uniref:Uncharacterized protein n=1 Tax=Mycena metata TaxID=1033252 RepID=A0AAD7MFL5_9AGAR|nr:hypothetical protein B0H16DRAFT_1477652 [Mycena metata]
MTDSKRRVLSLVLLSRSNDVINRQANLREWQRLSASVDAAGHSMLPVFLALSKFHPSERKFAKLRLNDIEENENGLTSSNWGPSSVSHALAVIRQSFDSMMSLVKALALLTAQTGKSFSKIQRATRSEVDAAFQTINASVRADCGAPRGLVLPSVEAERLGGSSSEDKFLQWMASQVANAYNSIEKVWHRSASTKGKENADRSYNEQSGVVKDYAETVGGLLSISSLKSIVFGVQIVDECVKLLDDLKTLEKALKIRITLVSEMQDALSSAPETVISEALLDHTKKHIKELLEIKEGLSYKTLQKSKIDFSETQKDYVDISSSVVDSQLLVLISERAEAQPAASRDAPLERRAAQSDMHSASVVESSVGSRKSTSSFGRWIHAQSRKVSHGLKRGP